MSPDFSLKEFFRPILWFFNLLDSRGNLSLTNVVLYVMVAKIAVAPMLSLPEMAAFFFALLNYAHKRTHSAKSAEKENTAIADVAAAVESVKAELSTISEKATTASDLASNLSMAVGFKRKSP